MIRFLVDTSSDYLPEEMEKKGIEFVPLQLSIGEKNYLDGVDISREEFFRLLIEDEVFPKTSQPSAVAFQEIFEDVKKKGDEMICIPISSTLSGTFQSAMVAKKMVDYEKIYLVDSMTATYAIKILTDHACKMREEGKSAQEIVQVLETLKKRIRIEFVVDTLEYLYRGGRLSKAAATLGTLANIKPVLGLDGEGIIKVEEKCLGLPRAYKAIIHKLQRVRPDTAFPIYTLYSYGTENTENLEKALRQAEIPITERLQIGATIGTHIGPGAAGLIYIAEETE
ncbi:MAG: DegV family protein [Lachnospiraceae bacterium]|nr:DegV family protein [Lachnospiraceae bacterium]